MDSATPADRSLRHRARRRNLVAQSLALAAMLALPSPSRAGDDKPDDRQRVAAIRALYGAGLSIDTRGDRVTIDWGELDAATYQRYVTRYYLPALEGWYFKLNVSSQIAFGDTNDFVKKKAAHILAEPLEKLDLCEHVAKGIDDSERQKAMLDFCRQQALRHALSPVVTFRGERVSYSSPGKFAGVTMGEPLYSGSDGARDVLITVPGPGKVSSDGPLRTVAWIANNLRYDAPATLERVAREAKQRAGDELRKAKSRVKARDRKLAGSRGAVLFTDHRVEGWEPLQPLSRKARPTCYDAFVHIYGPRRRGTYILTVRANGMQCSDDTVSGGFIRHWSVLGTCQKQVRSGKNEITVEIAKNVNKLVRKRKRIRHGRIEQDNVYSNKPGKVVTRGALVCTR